MERAQTWAKDNRQILDDVWQAKLKVIFLVYGEFVKALGDYQDISQIDALLVKYLQQRICHTPIFIWTGFRSLRLVSCRSYKR